MNYRIMWEIIKRETSYMPTFANAMLVFLVALSVLAVILGIILTIKEAFNVF